MFTYRSSSTPTLLSFCYMSAGDGRVFALKQVQLKGMKRVDREEAIDEVQYTLCMWLTCINKHVCHGAVAVPAVMGSTSLNPHMLALCAAAYMFTHNYLNSVQARVLSQLSHPYIIRHYDSFIGK